MKKIIIVQSSLAKNPKTMVVAKEAKKILSKRKNVKVEILDLRDYKILMCDEREFSKYPKDMQKIYKKLEKADGYIFAYPIYNYCFSGSFKNFLDLYTKPMTNKPYGVLNHSGGIRSWNQGIGELMKVLSLYTNMKMTQPAVHSWSGSFKDGKIEDKDLLSLIEEMTKNLVKAS